ncbi:hypothetical protein M6B38_406525 [Iris pallida]|uniref:Uncharacterized protein n=1 Tax=Iris pallida TaxID=29817 RepID=A0AAX6FQ81_IRIPA|nr:hypothetical protein M6B38_406525 [Iris pallida]
MQVFVSGFVYQVLLMSSQVWCRGSAGMGSIAVSGVFVSARVWC